MKVTLMNKNIEVLDFNFDEKDNVIEKIYHNHKENEKYLPYGIKDIKNGVTKNNLAEWINNRIIPKTRKKIKSYIEDYSSYNDLVSNLIVNLHGLNLTDEYWFKKESENIKWEDINYFDNDFNDEIGNSVNKINGITESSPSYFTNGNLYKYWIIENGKRYLIKDGSYCKQEPFNEVIATKLYERVLNKNEYVKYELYYKKNMVFSKCENFVTRNIEFVPAWYMIKERKQDNRENDFDFFLRCCKELGIENAKDYMNKMLTCDYILGNSDRHYNNFGAIRNIDTLKFIGMSPIFDTGASLGTNDNYEREYHSKPFYKNPEKQLELVDDLSWLDIDKLKGFEEEAEEILKKNKLMYKEDIKREIENLINRIDYVKEYKEKLNKNVQ